MHEQTFSHQVTQLTMKHYRVSLDTVWPIHFPSRVFFGGGGVKYHITQACQLPVAFFGDKNKNKRGWVGGDRDKPKQNMMRQLVAILKRLCRLFWKVKSNIGISVWSSKECTLKRTKVSLVKGVLKIICNTFWIYQSFWCIAWVGGKEDNLHFGNAK